MSRWHFQAGGFVLNSSEVITISERMTAGRANDLVFQVAADVRELRLGIVGLLGFERPGLNRAIDLAQVVNAGIHLGGGASLYEVGDRDCGQEANDGHYNHDLHQGKACPWGCFCLHTEPFCRRGVNEATGGL